MSGEARTLNIIGAGRAGRACGRMWARAGLFEIQDVLTRSRESAAEGVKFIGAGHPAGGLAEMRAADVWMIATRDDAIVPSIRALAASGKLAPGNIVFHVSGATPSSALAPARESGALIASVHPIKTFTDAEAAVRTFAGTYCSAEGDAEALSALKPAFEKIGAMVFDIAPGSKAIYHAGGIFACNYLSALMESALRCHEKAGIARAISLKALEPLVRETVDAIFAQGPARALTGPISRADIATIRRQLEALDGWDRGVGGLYRRLGLVALALAEADGRLDPERAGVLRRALSPRGNKE